MRLWVKFLVWALLFFSLLSVVLGCLTHCLAVWMRWKNWMSDYLDEVEKNWGPRWLKENFHTFKRPLPWQNSVEYPTNFKKQAVPNFRSWKFPHPCCDNKMTILQHCLKIKNVTKKNFYSRRHSPQTLLDRESTTNLQTSIS